MSDSGSEDEDPSDDELADENSDNSDGEVDLPQVGSVCSACGSISKTRLRDQSICLSFAVFGLIETQASTSPDSDQGMSLPRNIQVLVPNF